MDTATNNPPRRPGPEVPELALTDAERTTLSWARRGQLRPGAGVALSDRAGLCQERQQPAVATRLGISRPMVTKWRSRLSPAGWRAGRRAPAWGGPHHHRRAGRAGAGTDVGDHPLRRHHWSTRSLARQLGMSQSAISRIWRALGSSRTWSIPSSCRPTHSSSTRSATWSGST
jgi:hypothetical protein